MPPNMIFLKIYFLSAERGGGEAKETNEAWHNTLKEGYKHQLQTELIPQLISRASRGIHIK